MLPEGGDARGSFFLYIEDGSATIDEEGSEFPDMNSVRDEAVRLSGEILRDMGERFWPEAKWALTVTDEDGRKVLGLRFTAD